MEVEQTFLPYRENTSMRLQKIEEMLELALQKWRLITKAQQGYNEEKFINPSGYKESVKPQTGGKAVTESQGTLCHLELKFPRFQGNEQAAEWLEKCQQFFSIYNVEESKKVSIAGLHLEGVAKCWFRIFKSGKPKLGWEDFCNHFSVRFGNLEQNLLYANFKQLQQTSTLEVYFNQFEGYMEQLKRRMPLLTECYFVECFVGGLQENLKYLVRLWNPTTVTQAFEIARGHTKSALMEKDSKKLSPGSDISKPPTKEVFKDYAAWENYIGEPIYDKEPVYDDEDSEVFDCEQQWADFGIGNKAQEWSNLTEKFSGVDVAPETYTVEPIYDENPWEDQECWPEQDFILAALGGGNSDSPYTLQSEIFTNEKSEEFEEFSNLKDFDSLPDVCEEVCLSLMSTENDAQYLDNHQRGRKSPIAAKFSDLEEKSSHPHKNKMIIFDPGGYVHHITADNGIQGVGEESKEVVYEINQHYVDSTRVGMKVKSKCMVMRQGILEMYRLMGLEDSSQYKLNFKEDTSTCAKGLDCPTDVKNFFSFVPIAMLAFVLRITSTQAVSALKEGLDKPKELKPELHVPENWTIQLQGRLYCDTYLKLVSQDVVSMEVSGKAVESTQKHFFVGILVHYKATYVFDPGGLLSCFFEAHLVGGYTGFLDFQSGLQDVLHGKELYKNKSRQEDADMYLIQMEQSLEVQDPP